MRNAFQMKPSAGRSRLGGCTYECARTRAKSGITRNNVYVHCLLRERMLGKPGGAVLVSAGGLTG